MFRARCVTLALTLGRNPMLDSQLFAWVEVRPACDGTRGNLACWFRGIRSQRHSDPLFDLHASRFRN
jgi:hypothetical protein